MRPGLVVALALMVSAAFEAGEARAAAMPHYDLAGLVLESDAIVVATRRPTADGPSHYRVLRSVRGPLQVGAELEIDDRLYIMDGRDLAVDVIAFLRAGDGGAWSLTSSGLRVTEAGRVYRFEQWDNPGGFTMVAQGHDPVDLWQGPHPTVDRATFDRELAAAMARADALAPALALADPDKRRAAAFALLSPIGASEPGMGFYRDEVSARIAAGLAAAGDLEGALDARARDRSGSTWPNTFGSASALLAIAAAATQPAARRVQAVEALRGGVMFADAPVVRGVLALVNDADPAVRAAAVTTAASVWGWSGGRRADGAINRKLSGEVKRALAKRFAGETDGTVLHALAAAHEGRRLPARRGGPPVAAAVRVVNGELHVDVRCLGRRPVREPYDIIYDGAQAPGWIEIACGADRRGGAYTDEARWSVGPRPLAITVTIDRKPVTVPLGTLTVAPNGEMTLTPP